MSKRWCVVIAAAAGLALTQALADPVNLKSPPSQATLLELYTSEGCSSCPPADRWLSGLKEDRRLWRQLVPVAFHVDYWDYIGWPDRFASPAYGQRQRAHARNWAGGTVYTPGLVRNGDEWRAWFRDRRLELAPGREVGTLELTVDAGRAQARFRAAAGLPERVELHLAVLGFGLSTQVKAGENRGRKLEHDFVVLGYQRVALSRRGDEHFAGAPLPSTRATAPRRALAAWVTLPDDPRPIQAVGGWL